MKTSQTILITGATAGIGRHAALHLAAKGHHVIATGRNGKALDELRAAATGRLDTVRLDVTDRASLAAAVAEVDRLTAGRGLDVLVNNAGWGLAAPMLEVTDEDLRAQYETNVFGLAAVTRAFVPKMVARGSGRLINVSSIGGRVTLPLFGAYNSTKYAVESISDALRMELAPFGVSVSLIEPGPILTEFSNRSMTEIARYRDPKSPYAPIYARAEEIRATSDRNSASPAVVTRAIEHAATARRPRVRYVMPRLFAALLRIGALLPTRLMDWAMARSVGLTRRNLAARRPAPELSEGTSAAV